MQNKTRFIGLKERLLRLTPAALAASLVLMTGVGAPASTSATSLILSGTGAAPQTAITLVLPGNVLLKTTSAKDGSFTFRPIPYDFAETTNFELLAPVADLTQKKILNTNSLQFKINPRSSVAVTGMTSKAASIAVSVGGESANAAVSNNKGYYKTYTKVLTPLSSKNALVAASIMNTETVCCPRMLTPTQPLVVTLKGNDAGAGAVMARPAPTMIVKPVAPAQKIVPPPSAAIAPTPNQVPAETPAQKPVKTGPKPIFLSPINATPDDVIEQRSFEKTTMLSLDVQSFAMGGGGGGVASDNWVKGMKTVADIAMEALYFETAMIGGFIDAKNHLESQLSLQKLTAQAMKDYMPGEALCQFGTLTRSLAATEEHAQVTQRAFNEVMIDRDTMRKQTANSEDAGSGDTYRMTYFQENYCHRSNENDALRRFCSAAVTADKLNRDIDYTRRFDMPLTLDVNFISAPSAAQKQANADVTALGSNLFGSEAFKGFTSDDLMNGAVTGDDVQNYRSISAARSVARNSFTKLVGMKAMNKSNASQQYMLTVLKQLGMSDKDSKRLIGSNPSYFAQMEVLTKKIYQNPWFFAELYDKPANVDRQRTAMLGISLQQQHDLLESLQRREMLLSTLLELKIRNAGSEN